MTRRNFIQFVISLPSALIFLFSSAGAQQVTPPLVGFMQSAASGASIHMTAAFQNGLKEAGFIAGQNITIEYRFADNQYDRLPGLATDLIGLNVKVLGAFGPAAAEAAKAATTTTPIVFTSGNDPAQTGLLASLNRPRGNMTGVSLITAALEAKRLEILSELVPSAATIGIFINSKGALAAEQSADVQKAAAAMGRQVLIVN